MADDGAAVPEPRVPGLQPSEDPATRDHEVEQLRTLLRKVTERARVAEEAAQDAFRQLESARAALAQERASSALLGEMAGEAERRAMKAEATNEALRAHLSGAPPVSPVAAAVAGLGRAPTQPARQQLEGLVRELSHPVSAEAMVEVPPAAVEPQPEPEAPAAVAEPGPLTVPMRRPDVATLQTTPAQAAVQPARQVTAQPVPRGSVTVLPGASPRRRWSR